MSDTGSFLSLGSPRFSDPRLAGLARSGNAEAAWREAGTGGLAAVQGNFAVGLYESAERGWLAVDRFGIESICWRVVDGRVRFAARADELADAGTPIDCQAIFDYLYFHAIPSPRTIFQGVHRLPPGHRAVFDQGRVTVSPYWQPTFDEPSKAVSFEALAVEFRQLLRDAVETQLDGGKPACFLSGGTDSSTVAGMIGDVSGRRAATYSIGFDAQGYDEMAFARIAARHFDTEHHEYYVTPDDLVASIAAVATQFDQPFGNSSALPAYYCAKMARDDGVTKLLAGDGGDELFGGNTRYAKQRIFGWWDRVPQPLRAGLMEPMLAHQAGQHRPALVRKAASYVEQARVPMPDRLQMYNLILRLDPARVLTPALLARVDQQAPLAQQRETWASARNASSVNRQLAFDWRYTLAESDLPKVNGATALAGIDVGFPLLDDRLLEFSCRLPSDYKLKGLKLRWFFKEALRGFLPGEIITKKKQGFGLPFGVWATRHASLHALARESLHGIAERGIARREFIEELLLHRLAEHPGYYGEMVWILMMLEQWLRSKAPAFRLEH